MRSRSRDERKAVGEQQSKKNGHQHNGDAADPTSPTALPSFLEQERRLLFLDQRRLIQCQCHVRLAQLKALEFTTVLR
jgi:hypothetical protein